MAFALPFRRRPESRPVSRLTGRPAPWRERAPLPKRRFAAPGPVPLLAVVCVAGIAGAAATFWWEGARDFAGSAPATVEAASASGSLSGAGVSGRVTRVIDGDTFKLSCCRESIRLWAIDAPERRTASGPAATAALRGLIDGRSLACRQRDIDRYGRIVGQCRLADGSDLGARLLATGTVREYCHFSGNHYGTC